MSDTLAAVHGIENLTPAGRRATVDVANSLGIDPDWLVSVMSFESAGSFDPAKKNAAGSGATGMIQFMPSTAQALGYTIAQIASMSQESQIRGPVFQYLKGHGKLSSLDDVYLAIFYPKAIGQPDSFVVGKQGSAVYEQNRGFDPNGTGVITKGAIVSTIRGVYNRAIANGRVEVPAPSFFDSSPSLGSSPSELGESSNGEPETKQDDTSNGNFILPTPLQPSFWDKALDFVKGLFS